jgi:hypothetical protein
LPEVKTAHTNSELRQLNNEFLIFPSSEILTKNLISLIKHILNNSLKSYDLLCTIQLNEQQLKNIKKNLKYNYEIVLNLIKCYKFLNKPHKIYKLLVDFSSYLTDKHSQFLKANVSRASLVDFIDYLYKVNFKLCLFELYYATSSNDLNETHFNDIEIYLAETRTLINQTEFDLKTSKCSYLKGMFNKISKNKEKALECFVIALDLIDSSGKGSGEYDADNNEDYFDVKVFVRVLYDNITDMLISMNRLNDALLVCEHHRNSHSIQTNSADHPHHSADSLNIIMYFRVIKSNSTLNCWFIHSNSTALVDEFNILHFQQTHLDEADKCLSLDSMNFVDNRSDLSKAYDILIKPFEAFLFIYIIDQLKFGNKFQFKPNLIFVHDGSLFKVPFHMLAFEYDSKKFCIYEFFRINTVESLYAKNANKDDVNSYEKCRFLNNLKDVNDLIENHSKFKFRLLYVNLKMMNDVTVDGGLSFSRSRLINIPSYFELANKTHDLNSSKRVSCKNPKFH